MGITVEALHDASEPVAPSQGGGAKPNENQSGEPKSVAQSGGPKPAPAGPLPDRETLIIYIYV